MSQKIVQNWIVYGYRMVQKAHPDFGHIKYVGITCRPKRRNRDHQQAAKNNVDWPFYRAIRKYGFEAFEFVVLASNLTADQAKQEEKKFISQLRKKCHLYNATAGGDGVLLIDPMKRAAAYRHASERMKQLHQQPEFAAATRERLRKAREALRIDPDYKRESRLRFQLMRQKPEFAIAQSRAASRTMAALNRDPSFRAAQDAARTRTIIRPDYREALAKGIKRRDADPRFLMEHKERGRKRMIRLHRDKAFKLKVDIGRTKHWLRFWADRGDRERVEHYQKKLSELCACYDQHAPNPR
jgi:hypothetical protein